MKADSDLGWRVPIAFLLAVTVLVAPAAAQKPDSPVTKVPVKRLPPKEPGGSPTNTWCTYDVKTGHFGAVTVTFSGFQNKMIVNTCISDVETPGDGGIIEITANGKTISSFTDRWGQNIGLSRDIYIRQEFLSASDLARGREVSLFVASSGWYDRACLEDRGPPVTYIHSGTLSTHSKNSIVAQAADKGYIIYEEHGLDQC